MNMIVDKVRNIRTGEPVPVTVSRKVSHDSPADEARANITQVDKMPVIYPLRVKEQFYGPHGKIVREEISVSWYV